MKVQSCARCDTRWVGRTMRLSVVVERAGRRRCERKSDLRIRR